MSNGNILRILLKTPAYVLSLIILGILGGAYVAFGTALSISLSTESSRYLGSSLTALISGAAFSAGFIMIILTGAELFTANNLMMGRWLERKISLIKMLSNWVIVYAANLAGAVAVAFLIFKTDLWQQNNFIFGHQTLALANSKVNLPFMSGVYSGICGNWLICSGIMIALNARTVSGKIMALLFPIMTSFALGFEHCIANMYIIPMGMFLKTTSVAAAARLKLTNLTTLGFLTKNLLPVTAGNIIGGAGLVSILYWMADKGK